MPGWTWETKTCTCVEMTKVQQKLRKEEDSREKMDKEVKEKEVKIPQNNLVENLNVEWLTSYHVLPLGEKITVRVLHFSSWSNLFVCTEAQFPQLMKFQVRSPLSSLCN